MYKRQGTIALRLSSDGYEISPGSKGTVEFYIIPTGRVSKVTLQIGLGGYGADANDNNQVKPIDNPVLNALMSGHILMFDKYENGTYSEWLFDAGDDNESIFNNSITVDLTEAEIGEPFAVDFHWIWPLRYENMATMADLSGFINSQSASDAMTKVNETSSYSYSRIFLTDKSDLSTTAARSRAYDMADEYIGSNAQYLYLTIQTSASDAAKGGTQ